MRTLWEPQVTKYEAEAIEFDTLNPLVWMEFKTIALRLIDRGVKHYGAKAIFEIIRYHRIMETTGPDYKLNNNYTAYYARKFIVACPRFNNFFDIRESK